MSGDEPRDDEVETLARAMLFGEACDRARSVGALGRAFELALEARDAARVDAVAHAIAAIGEPAAREAMANRARAAAVRRGDAASEGAVCEAIGADEEAAPLFERGGAWGRAAAVHGRRGDFGRAGRALERRVREDPTDAEARIELGGALLAAGRLDAALRALDGLSGDERVTRLRARAHAGLGLGPAVEGSASPSLEVASEGGELLFGRYRVLREVASTPTSRVLEALDRLTPDRPRVALKIFTGGAHLGAGRDARARFEREMAILQQIEVPSVMRPRALIAEGPTLVLPWMAGGSVEGAIAKGAVTPARAAEIVVRVLEALAAAHRRGIVHRDVKPANVLLDEAGGAYLADFGVAHLGDASATATAGLLGTLRYMSPEQKRGEPASTKSDVYSTGVVTAELLGLPVEASRWPPSLPKEIAALLSALLAEDPAARPDAASAHAKISAISWPDRAVADARAPSDGPPSSLRPTAAERFAADASGQEHARVDGAIGRRELLIAVHDPRAPLAFALSVVGHPALPVVIGVDAETTALRVEALEGVRVTDDAPLDARERTLIEDAVAALHAHGVAHGSIARSILRTPRGPALAFPDRDATSAHAPVRPTMERDLAELRALRKS